MCERGRVVSACTCARAYVSQVPDPSSCCSPCCPQERLRQDLKVEQERRAEADLRRRQAEASGLQLQLQNPSLSLAAMQGMIDAQDQVSPVTACNRHAAGGGAYSTQQLLQLQSM